jgi:hypothetical protein
MTKQKQQKSDYSIEQDVIYDCQNYDIIGHVHFLKNIKKFKNREKTLKFI